MAKDINNSTVKGNWIILKGITAYGKKYIQKYGSNWYVERDCGNRWMLRSKYKTFKLGRNWHDDDLAHTIFWINVPNDNNFEILVSTLYNMPE